MRRHSEHFRGKVRQRLIAMSLAFFMLAIMSSAHATNKPSYTAQDDVICFYNSGLGGSWPTAASNARLKNVEPTDAQTGYLNYHDLPIFAA